MSPFVSRLVVAAVLLPLVLGIVWLGGWWLFGLAAVGGLLALHELFTISRSLRPIVLGGYVGVLLTLLGAQLGGATWVLPSVSMACFVAPSTFCAVTAHCASTSLYTVRAR